jgi:hypothetical protein
MVIKHRWRMMLGLVLLWSASALVTGFFVVQTYEGARGIEAKRQIKNRVFALRGELVELKGERSTATSSTSACARSSDASTRTTS